MRDLPKEIILTADKEFVMSEDLATLLNEEINDYLSDKYGYCVEAYGYEIKVSEIFWDTSEDEAYEQDKEWDKMRNGRE